MAKLTPKPIIPITLGDATKQEWITKEEGSFEDYKRHLGDQKPEGKHVFEILCDSRSGKLDIYSKAEANTVLVSARYHDNGWDWGENPIVDRLMRTMPRVIQSILSTLNPSDNG